MDKFKNAMWVEKYRPSNIDDVIMPPGLKKQVESMIQSDSMTHILISGLQGTGKTTLAHAIIKMTGGDVLTYNGSDGSLNLEELREKISEFANTTSIKNSNTLKYILIDEADGLNWQVQPALRHAMEKYSSTCRFILTCNYADKIIPPIHSRCASLSFTFDKKTLNDLVKIFAKRCVDILQKENITYDVEILKQVILKYYPDGRKVINELQRYSNTNGCIDEGILGELESSYENLFSAVNQKDFPAVKQWCTDNCTPTIFNSLYREGEKYLAAGLLPLWILKLAEYQKYHGVVPNPELNVLGCITEYMAEAN